MAEDLIGAAPVVLGQVKERLYRLVVVNNSCYLFEALSLSLQVISIIHHDTGNMLSFPRFERSGSTGPRDDPDRGPSMETQAIKYVPDQQ
jgi:hypothetical protein